MIKMGRPIVHKILYDILENDRMVDSELLEALIYRSSVAGGDKFELYNNLVYLADVYHSYIYGDKKELTKEMEDMS